MATSVIGPLEWSVNRDDDGHREYNLTMLIHGDTTDGPANALRAPGLFAVGAPWLVDADVDAWAYCTPRASTKMVNTREPNRWQELTQVFSTKPRGQRCYEADITNPLLEPQKISGSFVNKTVEATHDRFGNRILTSSFEQVRGPQVEFDESYPTVHIEQNVALLQLELLAALRNHLNDRPLWGLPARCVLLHQISWEKIRYGTCNFYYKRILDFQCNDETFDRNLLDEGTKALRGHWDNPTGAYITDDIGGSPPNPSNPTHFDRYKDRRGENTRVILNGAGLPADTDIGTGTGFTGTGTNFLHSGLGNINVQYYQEGNLLLLGIPTVL